MTSTYSPFFIIAALAYAALGLIIKPPRDTTAETRCRKCGYILKGLTKLECPECGEGI